MRVDEVELGESIAFRWAPAPMPEAETRVELRLEDAEDGATRDHGGRDGLRRRPTVAAPGRVAAAAWAWEAALMALAALFVLVAVA